jgi:SSS family solute:Na+ symporter/sodium/pantothenate symporter
MVTNDLWLQIAKPSAKDRSLLASRLVLVGVGLVAFALAVNPPKLVGLFAQKGVYGLAAASFVPIVFGVLVRGAISARVMGLAAATGLGVHLGLDLVIGVSNPAISACYAIIASVMIALLSMAWLRARRPST